jgi:membrane associated rhomboid family serine protease
MFPLKDDNPISITPVVTWIFIAVNAAAFLYQLSLNASQERLLVYQFGAIPAVISGVASLSHKLSVVPPFLSILTGMFLHGGWMHLIGNMWFLWVFGNNIEEAMGHLRFFLFYLFCGYLASSAHILFNFNSAVPMIGASGAIAGVLGAYLMLYPRARVLTLFFFWLLWLPAGFILGYWFLLQLWSGSVVGQSMGGGVAYGAHVGGFLAGLLLVGLFKRREVRFFSPANSSFRSYH